MRVVVQIPTDDRYLDTPAFIPEVVVTMEEIMQWFSVEQERPFIQLPSYDV